MRENALRNTKSKKKVMNSSRKIPQYKFLQFLIKTVFQIPLKKAEYHIEILGNVKH